MAKFSDQRLQKLFWITSRSISEAAWMEAMQKIEALNLAARIFQYAIETER